MDWRRVYLSLSTRVLQLAVKMCWKKSVKSRLWWTWSGGLMIIAQLWRSGTPLHHKSKSFWMRSQRRLKVNLPHFFTPTYCISSTPDSSPAYSYGARIYNHMFSSRPVTVELTSSLLEEPVQWEGRLLYVHGSHRFLGVIADVALSNPSRRNR